MEKHKPRMGRPKLPEAERLSERVVVLLTESNYRKLLRLGGVAWIRERIRQARE